MAGSVEVSFARKLASNETKTRSRAIKSVRKWISSRSALSEGFDELELLKLWKGLFVCMWHSDKPLVQEELASNISGLTHSFQQPLLGLRFVATFFTTMVREWQTIDRLRIDKFYLLIRKVLSAGFQLLVRNDWNTELVQEFCDMLRKGPFSTDLEPPKETCLGLQLHMVDVFMPELLAVAPPTSVGSALLQPCCSLLATTTNSSVSVALVSSVFEVLLATEMNFELSAQLLALAVDRNTAGRNRKALYNLHRRFKTVSDSYQEEECLIEHKKKKLNPKARKQSSKHKGMLS